MSNLVLTEKMLGLLTLGSPAENGELLARLYQYHLNGIDYFTLDEIDKPLYAFWKLLKAEYDKNKRAAERVKKCRANSVTPVTVTLQKQQEKESPNEKESPSPAPLPKEKENTKEKELIAQTEFERWWKEYPRKVSKKKSREVFRGKCKKLDLNDIKSLVNLMLAETKAQGSKYGWTKDREQYIPHPSTWLYQERYLDGVSKENFTPFSQNNKTAAKRPANYLPSEGGTDGAF